MDRQKFSEEGGVVVTSESSSPPSHGGSLSHFARMDSSEVLKAATQDLLEIFQLKVRKYFMMRMSRVQ